MLLKEDEIAKEKQMSAGENQLAFCFSYFWTFPGQPDALSQGVANFFWKGPESKHFQLCRP